MMQHSNSHDSTSRLTTRLIPGLLFSCLVFSTELAFAVTDLSIMGSLELLTANATGSLTQTGHLSSTLGGSTNTTNFNKSGITSGAHPLTGNLTTIDDGFSASTELESNFESEYNYVAKFVIDFINSSLTDDYKVSLNFNFNHTVDSEGNDSFAESKLDIEQDSVDISSSEIVSDTFFGDKKNENGLLTSGDIISDSGDFDLDLIILAGASHQFMTTWEWEGALFEDPGLSTVDFFAEVKITNIMNLTVVPLPGALVFFASGLVGMGLIGRCKRLLPTQQLQRIIQSVRSISTPSVRRMLNE